MKKAFSSNGMLPLPKIYNGDLNPNIIKNERKTFLTIVTDDINFANDQKNYLDHVVYTMRQSYLKPWEKDSDNNIYKDYGKSNQQLIKSIKEKNKEKPIYKRPNNSLKTIIPPQKNIIKKNFIKTNIDNAKLNSNIKNIKISSLLRFKKYFRENSQNVFDGFSIAKNIQTKCELKQKLKPPVLEIKDYVIRTKQLLYSNSITHLLNKERNKIRKYEESYEKALIKELDSLSNDIHKFDLLKDTKIDEIKVKENELIKYIQINRATFENFKLLAQEHKSILEEIQKTIISINKCKSYAMNIFNILNIDIPELKQHDKEVEFRNFKNQTENEINQYISEVILNYTSLINNKKYIQISEELKNGNISLEDLYEYIENNIIKKLSEKSMNEMERKKLETEHLKSLQEIKKRDNTYSNEYILYMKDKQVAQNQIDLFKMNPDYVDFNNYILQLFYDLKNYLFDKINYNKKSIKSISEERHLSLVKTTVEEIKKLEFNVDKFINEIEDYEKENPEIFYKIAYNVRQENRVDKNREERILNEFRKLKKKEKLIKKFRRLIIPDKHKYNNDFNLIFKKKDYCLSNREKDNKNNDIDIDF